ncbi:hypothetical protein [Actinomyces oris]|jgi:hypothetical protein|uniref:hypothetical protein n=1 Tax=Actinomyces oris TaxID=544580 RepID=UPI001177C4E6|nr:hypothetical protein [Actinomyces oris]
MVKLTNQKYYALQRLKGVVDGKNKDLGFRDPYMSVNPGKTYASGVNSPQTWVSKLADSSAAMVEKDVRELAGAFTGFADLIDSAISNTPSTVEGVDENDTVGNWPPTGTDPAASRPSTFTNDDEI